MKHVGAGLVAFFFLSATAFAQVKGGGGFGAGADRMKVTWYPNLEKVIDTPDAVPPGAPPRRLKGMPDAVEKKYIFVYVRPLAESSDPGEFNNSDVVQLSHNEWAFVKMDFDRENAHLKAWGIKGAPVCLACDLHGNEFARTASATIDQIRRLTGSLPGLVARYEATLRGDYARALELLKTDESKSLRLFSEIVSNGKIGYKEVTEAQARVAEYGEIALRKAELPESVSPEAGIDYLDEIAKTFRGTATGVQAEIRIARLEHERGNPAAAILRLGQIQKSDAKLPKGEIEKVAQALDEISRAGEAKLEAALLGDKALAREAVRKIARDYAGTEAGKKANEAFRKLD
jgi:hypothetical protein